MGTRSRLGLLVALFLTLVDVPGVGAQRNTVQSDGWQGPRPAPQQRTPSPAPQSLTPSGKQVLEIPARPQPPVLDLPKPQAVSPSPLQPERARPTQLLSVTVTDQQGRYVSDLKPEDFLLYEEDLPQKLTYFNTGQNEPVSLGFLIDTSGSMLNKIGRARQALRRFVETIRTRDEVFLEAFNQRPFLLQDFTDSRALLIQATALLQPSGETALYDAILDGLRRVQQGRCQKKALVVITDGVDTESNASLHETINTVRRSGVMVYTVGIGDPAGGMRGPIGMPMQPLPMSPFMGPRRRGPMGMPMQPLPMSPPIGPRPGGPDESVDSRTLQMFSDETGGKNFLLNTADVVGSGAVLDGAVQTISDELRQQYSLGYTSPLKGDVYRSVRVETRRAGLAVRTPKGAE